MDLDRFIGENLDDILDNPDEYIIDKTNKTNKSNKIIKSFENTKKVKFVEFDKSCKNETEIDNSSDIYDEDYDDFGYEYKNNSDSYSDDEIDSNYDTNNENDDIDENNKEINEDDYTDDIIGELYQNMYETNTNKIDIVESFKNLSQLDFEKINNQDNLLINKKLSNEQNNKIVDSEKNEFANDDIYYFINLINIFMKYYNNKFDKLENFFSGIKNNDKDTSSQMELFFDSIVEYKSVKEKFGLDNDKCMELIYLDSDSDSNSDSNSDQQKIIELFDKWENQIYMLEMDNCRYISPSIIICLNYIYEKDIFENYWNIYNLRNV